MAKWLRKDKPGNLREMPSVEGSMLISGRYATGDGFDRERPF
jgi:hypothetical protein